MVAKVWYVSKTHLTTIISLLLTLIASPEVLNVVPAKYLVYIPAAAVVLQSILRTLPSDSQGPTTMTQSKADDVNAASMPLASRVRISSGPPAA